MRARLPRAPSSQRQVKAGNSCGRLKLPTFEDLASACFYTKPSPVGSITLGRCVFSPVPGLTCVLLHPFNCHRICFRDDIFMSKVLSVCRSTIVRVKPCLHPRLTAVVQAASSKSVLAALPAKYAIELSSMEL